MATEAANDLASSATPQNPRTNAVAPPRPSWSTSASAAAPKNAARPPSGRDIYAITAPLAVEAVHRILTGRTRATGVASAGALFDAPDFLDALSAHIKIDRT